MKRLSAILDPNGAPLNGLNVSDFVDAMALGIASAEVYTLPTTAKYVLLTGTTPFYCKFGAAGAIPATEVADGSASTLVLTSRLFAIPAGCLTIGFISPAASIVTIECFL